MKKESGCQSTEDTVEAERSGQTKPERGIDSVKKRIQLSDKLNMIK